MRVQVMSWSSQIGACVATLLEDKEHIVEIVEGSRQEPKLRVAHDVSHQEVMEVCRRLRPLELTVIRCDELEQGVLIEIPHPSERRSAPIDMDDCSVWIEAESEQRGSGFMSEIWAAGLRPESTSRKVRYHAYSAIDIQGDAEGSNYLGQCLALYCRGALGIEPVLEIRNEEIDADVRVRLPPETANADDLVSLIDVEIQSDDAALGSVLAGRLREAGFYRIHETTLEPEDALEKQLRVLQGTLVAHYLSTLRSRLIECVNETVEAIGIDSDKYPLVLNDPQRPSFLRGLADEGVGMGPVVIEFPVGAIVKGKRAPYSPFEPGSYSVSLISDSVDALEDLAARFRDAGFGIEKTQYKEEIGGVLHPPGFCISLHLAAKVPVIRQLARKLVEGEMREAAVPAEFPLRTFVGVDEENYSIVVEYPINDCVEGRLAERVSDPKYFDFKVESPNPAASEGIFESLKSWGFKEAEHEKGEGSTVPRISYGGAPIRLIQRISEHVHERMGLSCKLHRKWDELDDDIWVELPEMKAPSESAEEVASEGEETVCATGEPLYARVPHAQKEGERTSDAGVEFLGLEEDVLRVGDVYLARRTTEEQAHAPELEHFRHFCLDERTAMTLLHVAKSVSLGEPCLLEGETSTSKTSTVMLLAALLGQPVVRMNLNGQTDTGELIGRYVPEHLAARLPVGRSELLAAEDLLETETRMLLERVNREQREPTRLEVQQIMANEGFRTNPWRWQDGVVPLAMKKGWWLLLDEVNLAEPQVLERLNSVLEPNPLLVLSEHDNSVIGGSWGAAVHANFRIFATMNPAEYAGRSTLSPAYRDRWIGYRFVEAPREQEYFQMLAFLVWGSQPKVRMGQDVYAGRTEVPMYPELARLDEIEDLLTSLARFHGSVEAAAGRSQGRTGGLGANRRERVVYTRRSLLYLLAYLAGPAGPVGGDVPLDSALASALERYYIERLSTPEDRQVVRRLVDASGLGALIKGGRA